MQLCKKAPLVSQGELSAVWLTEGIKRCVFLRSCDIPAESAVKKITGSQPVIFQYLPYLSSHAQAASAATEPSDMAVVSWRTDFARQSPATNTPGQTVRQSSPDAA